MDRSGFCSGLWHSVQWLRRVAACGSAGDAMGRATRKRRRAAANAVGQDLLEAQDVERVDRGIAEEQLVFEDRSGSRSARKRVKKAVQQRASGQISAVEAEMVQKLQEKRQKQVQAREAQIARARRGAPHGADMRRSRGSSGTSQRVVDIWGEDEHGASTSTSTGTSTSAGRGKGKGRLSIKSAIERREPVRMERQPKSKSRAKKTVHVPHPGQSYNPTAEDHQEALGEVAYAERLRLAAVAEAAKPLEQRVRRRVRSTVHRHDAILLRLQEKKQQQQQKDGEEEKGEQGSAEEEQEQEEREEENAEEEEADGAAQVEVRVEPVVPQSAYGATASARASLAPVALSDELRGNLRSLTARGNSVSVQMRALQERVGAHERQKKSGPSRAPHRKKRQRWILKYKKPMPHKRS